MRKLLIPKAAKLPKAAGLAEAPKPAVVAAKSNPIHRLGKYAHPKKGSK